MANKKISELSAVTALAETDVLPVVVGGGTTNKVTFQNFLRNAPDGTAAAPSIANVGDQDTGILFPATNSVAVSTGGTQRFVVNGNGNVGIGESSPLTPLHVSSTGDTVVRITSADGNGAFLDLGDASDPDGGRVVYDSGSNLTFSTASTERLRLDSSGRLGLATTTPSTRFHLTGTDNNFITLDHATRTGSWIIEHSGTDSENLDFRQNNGSTTVRSYLAGRDVHEFHTNGSEAMRIDSSGRVGIGTSTPGAELDVDNGSANCTIRARTGTGFSSFLSLLPNGDGTGVALAANSDSSAQLFNQLNSHLAFGTNNTERARIDSAGRLMVGTTTNNGAFLTVDSGGDGSVALRDNGIENHKHNADSSIAINYNGYANGTTQFRDLVIYNGKQQHVATFDGSTSRVGIGSTSPQARLEVQQDSSTAYDSSDDSAQRSGTSSICITNHNDSTNSFSQLVFDTASSDQSIARIVAIRTGASSNDLAFVVEGSNTKREAMRLDSSGNTLLGGTTSPASATKSLAIFNGTAPTGSVTDGVVLYAEDVSSSSELKVRDEAGNVTTLSPHNFDLIPEGPSEDMAWSYYSEKDGKRINVDMLKAVRLLEQLTGEQLVFTG